MGTIASFGGNLHYSARVLDDLASSYKYAGYYKVEADSRQQFVDFVDTYILYLQAAYPGFPDYASDDYISARTGVMMRWGAIAHHWYLALVFCLAILFFSFLHYLVSRTKTMSIMKLNGFTKNEICFRVIVRLLTTAFLTSCVLISFLMLFIRDNNLHFVARVFGTNTAVCLVLLALFSCICRSHARHAETVCCIKGKRPIALTSWLNIICKILVSVITISAVTQVLASLRQMDTQKQMLANWGVTADYAILYPFFMGDDAEGLMGGDDPVDVPAYELYFYLNRHMRALYIVSEDYKPVVMEWNENNNLPGKIRLNPNYLEKFPVYDVDGQRIAITEDTEHSVYLVPEHYRETEAWLHGYMAEVRERFHDNLHVGHYGAEAREGSKEVVFIYTKEGQKIFSFNPRVFPDDGNLIPDPIIQVVTEANALVPDIYYAASNTPTLFIGLLEKDTALTYQAILPKLEEHGLDDNWHYMVMPDEIILEEIADLQMGAKISVIYIAGFAMLLSIFAFQGIYLLFQRNRLEFFLKKTFGHTFLQKHGQIFFVAFSVGFTEWLICMTGAFLFPHARYLLLRPQIDYLHQVFAIKLAVEFIFVAVLVRCFEKKNVSRMLKEGL